MSLDDFFLHLCRFFTDDYCEQTFKLEWSTSKGTAGGCINNATVVNNPQLLLKTNSSIPI